MIELEKVTFTYRKSKRPALSDITAKVGSGLYLLAGENGAGKTTLLHVISGLAHPQYGISKIDSHPSLTNNPYEMGDVFLLEDNMRFPGKTIKEFKNLHSRFYPNFSEEKFDENLKAFGQSGNEPMNSHSLGNLKKAQLSYVLALGVNVLLLDEPTNALDIEGRETLRKLIAINTCENQTIIVSTHTVSDLENLFDGAMIMHQSKLLFVGSEEDVAGKLAFEYSNQLDPDSLYSENIAGRYLNIYPSDGHEETRVDWKALYMALHSEKSQSIISQLQK
ncbi:MAG: ABC transporter ATP-binding protein [Muribaculaceae bacterium]|nr:ABC transporter ATP-binding protein [Muribaculaceae bacterium]MDE6521531.1 ABC transporter ATP-binding protein [Muribaculaceae bacterium]